MPFTSEDLASLDVLIATGAAAVEIDGVRRRVEHRTLAELLATRRAIQGLLPGESAPAPVDLVGMLQRASVPQPTIAWLCGRMPTRGRQWQVLGLYLSENEAVARCRIKRRDFVMPIEVGVDLPGRRVWNKGCYYPLAETAEQAAKRMQAVKP